MINFVVGHCLVASQRGVHYGKWVQCERQFLIGREVEERVGGACAATETRFFWISERVVVLDVGVDECFERLRKTNP